MKAKKALKRLNEIEQILGEMQEKYTPRPAELDQVLQAANASVLNAKTLVEADNRATKHKRESNREKVVESPGAGRKKPARKRLSRRS
jgi:hypothetical protein